MNNNNKYNIPLFQYRKWIDAATWAEENMILKDSGKYSFSKTPFFREPTIAASDVINNCRVVVSSGAQLGKSSMMINILCHAAIYNPSNVLVILDSNKTAQRMSKNRIKPALRDFAHVKSLIRGSKMLDKSSEVMNISLGSGSNLILGGSSSASDLCSTPVPLLLLDELDRFERDLTNEGDSITLALKRQLRFNSSMALLTSTPTTTNGAITQFFLTGTQEIWGCFCNCGKFLDVKFEDIDFNNSIPTYTCKNCGEVYTNDSIQLLKHGYCTPQNNNPYKDKNGRICRSFKITTTLAHGIYTWEQLKREEQQALSLGESAVRSFYNTSLGEPYESKSIEIKDFTGLLKYRYNFNKNNIPNFVSYIFASADVQDKLFETLVIGTSEDGKQICLIEHRQILGDLNDCTPWDNLKKYLNDFLCKRVDGKILKINLMTIDSGGHFYNEVLGLGLQSPLVRPVKGRSYKLNIEEDRVIDRISMVSVKATGMSGQGKVPLTFVNTRFCKDFIYNKLSLLLENKQANLFISAEPDALFDNNFFEELTSEVKTQTTNGYSLYIKKPNVHNECLDIFCYALAASELYRLAMYKLPSLSVNKDDYLPDLNNNNSIKIDEPIISITNNNSISNTIDVDNNINNNIDNNKSDNNIDNNTNNNKSDNNNNNISLSISKKLKRLKPL